MANENKRPMTAFIPKPLEIEGRPELNKFPANILFLCGSNSHFFALYTPVTETYQQIGDHSQMIYANSKDVRGLVTIDYCFSNNQWQGSKLFNNEDVGMAFGSNWQAFFVHLTLLGTDCRERHDSIASNL